MLRSAIESTRQLAQGRWLKVEVALYRQAKSASNSLQLREREAAKLVKVAPDESKEDILAIKFRRIPCPMRIWSEEFDMGNGVEAFVLLPSDGREPLA